HASPPDSALRNRPRLADLEQRHHRQAGRGHLKPPRRFDSSSPQPPRRHRPGIRPTPRTGVSPVATTATAPRINPGAAQLLPAGGGFHGFPMPLLALREDLLGSSPHVPRGVDPCPLCRGPGGMCRPCPLLGRDRGPSRRSNIPAVRGVGTSGVVVSPL